ncbi:hypothetical protein MCOR02_003523 [Pyricularia oryzae]|nr:hypothetical protein MCOR02_003523 [Pyricularia oryzae]KAI6462098.1 hypothetical protein MCOR15_004796 [Pyricularia oryzae]KAI6541593.1 hypothetical protein MCOR16_000550 [Pyricularia oryzae]KAI6560624.1 hypothetical protein MCOR04_009665 [Pyricularia oryzae]KAI6632417.1 hypothetical protein MCOR08_005491 [Pyricularia oryzae]
MPINPESSSGPATAMANDKTSPEIVDADSSQKKTGRLLSKIKSAFKSTPNERWKEIEAQRPPRRDSDEWSHMTDPEDSTKRVKKRKKKMVTYNDYHTQGYGDFWTAKGGRF